MSPSRGKSVVNTLLSGTPPPGVIHGEIPPQVGVSMPPGPQLAAGPGHSGAQAPRSVVKWATWKSKREQKALAVGR